jgi:hypothetical protein
VVQARINRVQNKIRAIWRVQRRINIHFSTAVLGVASRDE